MEKLSFEALQTDGRNYNDWKVDVENHLLANKLQDSIVTDDSVDRHAKAKALVLIRHHITLPLRRQYKTISNPRLLWEALKSRYEHIKSINLPNSLQSWVNLRVQDFKTVDEYNSEMYHISSDLELSGQPVTDIQQIEKTLATFHPTNLVISSQYRNMKFTTYSELISHMLLAEQNSILLMKNSRDRPPGTLPIPQNPEANPKNQTEANIMFTNFRGRGRGRSPSFGRGGGRYGGRGGRSYNSRGRGRGRYTSNTWRRQPDESRATPDNTNNQEKTRQRTSNQSSVKCYRCGTKGHTQSVCETPQHLASLYKKSVADNKSKTYGNYMESAEIIPHIYMLISKDINKDTCIIDSGTSHSVFRNRKYFKEIKPSKRNIVTIMGTNQLEEGHGSATVILPAGTIIKIDFAIFAPNATRNLLSFRDIRNNGYHIHTAQEDSREVLHIIQQNVSGNQIKEILPAFPFGIYAIKTLAYSSITRKNSITETWHDRLGHPGQSMFYKIIKSSHGIPKEVHPTSLREPCVACSKGKFITAPSKSKLQDNIPTFLADLRADVCGPISPSSGPFLFFLAMICANSKWLRVSLISTRNLVFPRILSHILRLKAQFPEYPIKTLRVDGAGEFISKTFHDFCLVNGIDVQYSVPYVHFQNGIAESLIKRIQLIATPLLMQSKLPSSAWGHAVLHASSLLLLRPSAFNSTSPYELAFGNSPDLKHLRIFGCQVMVPILGPAKHKLGLQRKSGIYVGYDSPSIIRYLDPSTADVYKARFQDSHFYETVFPTLLIPTERQHLHTAEHFITWHADPSLHPDPRTTQGELKVKRLLQLKSIMENLPDSFADAQQVTKSHIPAENTPARILPDAHLASDGFSKPKRGRPQGATDKQPRKKRGQTNFIDTITDNQQEMSVHYNYTGHIHDRSRTCIDLAFAYATAQDIENLPDPKSVKEAKKQVDWPQWQSGMHSELDSLIARKVFGPVAIAKPDQHLTGYKMTFVKKRNSKGIVIRHKARLVAKGYTQIYGKDYDYTYSPVMDSTTYRYLIAFAVFHGLLMRQMDIVTAYLYGELDKVIIMEAPPELIERIQFHAQPQNNSRVQQSSKLTEFDHMNKLLLHNISRQITLPDTEIKKVNNKTRFAVQVLRSLYGLKQSGRTWYKRFQKDMIAMGFINSDIAPCLFLKSEGKEFIIIAIYVDDLNLFGTAKIMHQSIQTLKSVFEMRDMGDISYCIGLQFEYLTSGILLHQETYIKKILQQFHMDSLKSVRSPMDVRTLNEDKDIFRKREDGEPLLGSEFPYLSAIGALMFLANQTRPEIAFPVNLLARHSLQPTLRHWNGIKKIFRYLLGTKDTGLFFQKQSELTLTGYADAGYLSDPQDGRSQTGYAFLLGNTSISWRSTKQTLATTSSNHSEIVALYETTKECIWLRKLINHILKNTGNQELNSPTILFEDNLPCLTQIKNGYIKGDKTKHIAPKFFFSHEQQGSEIDIQWIPTHKNVADIFTKSLPPALHNQLTNALGLRSLHKLKQEQN